MSAMLTSVYEKRAGALASKGEYEAAIKWYRRAGNDEAVADCLLASGHSGEALTEFVRLGLLEKAAAAALKQGDPRRAAEFLERIGDHQRAINLLLEAGLTQPAIAMCLERGMKDEAAKICLSKGLRRQAARLFVDVGRFDRAIEMYWDMGDADGLFDAYVARGGPDAAAQECEAAGEHRMAARLWQAFGDLSRAAAMWETAGDVEKAAALFQQAEDYDRLAQLRERTGRLDLAAAAYELTPGSELEAATLYSKLVVLKPTQSWTFEAVVLCGAMAADGDAAALGFDNRTVSFSSRALEPRWQFRLGGEMMPSCIAVSDNGKKVAIGTDAPLGSSGQQLFVLDDVKQVLLQRTFAEPLKQVCFYPGEPALIAAAGDDITCTLLNGSAAWEHQVDFKARALDVADATGLIAIGTIGGELILLDFSGKRLARLELGDRIPAVRFDASGERLAALVGDETLVFCDQNLRVIKQVSPSGIQRFLEVLPGREYLALAGPRGLSVVNWEGETLSLTETEADVSCLFLDSLGRRLFAGTAGGGVTSFNPEQFPEKSAELFAKAGRLKEAAEIYEQIASFEKAYDLFRQLGEYENAARVVHATGDDVRAARHYEVVGRFEQAAKLYEGAGENALAARCYGRAGDTFKAAQLFEKLGDQLLAADFYEQHGDHMQAAGLFKKANQPDRARTNLEQWLKLHPGDLDAIFDLGSVYASENRSDEAIRLLQRLTDSEQYKREALRLLGECFLSKSLPDVAIDRFEEAIGENKKITRENIDLFYDIGCAHEQATRFNEASDVFGKVMAIDYYYRDIQERLTQSRQMSVMRTKPNAQGQQAQPEDSLFVTPGAESQSPPAQQRYRIIKKLGQGGMGVVYLAMDERLSRQVAWKVLPSHLSGDSEFQARFLREARAVAQLANPHIVGVFDIVTEANQCFITMEYIDGYTLRQKLRDTPQLPLIDACRHGMEIAEALAVAHRSGIIHRDVKPENIMITRTTGDVKMVDFGLARLGEDNNLTREGVIAGTLSYMAPEQIRAEGLDYRVDIYALGIILFEMLAGRAPFQGENILGQHLHADVPDLRQFRDDLPEDMVALTLECLSKERDMRPESGEAIHDRLKALRATAADSQTAIFEPL